MPTTQSFAAPEERHRRVFSLERFRRELALIMAAELDEPFDTRAQQQLILRGTLRGISYGAMEDAGYDVLDTLTNG